LFLSFQKLLFRILRPYWWQQREVQRLLVSSVRELAQETARASRQESRQRDALESLWTTVHVLETRADEAAGLEQRTGELAQRLKAIARRLEHTERLRADQAAGFEQRTGALEQHVPAIAAFQKTAADHLRALADRAAGLEQQTAALEQQFTGIAAFQKDATEHLRALTDQLAATQTARLEQRTRVLEQHVTGIAAFQEAAAEHLKALTDQLSSTTARATELSQRLYAIPYMHDKDRFSYSGEGGACVLGFRGRRSTNADLYVGFEDIFRGSEPFVRDRLRVYVPLLKNYERVIEIGCGRGELLDLLREAGVSATGVDTDEAMVERCRAKGHTVEHDDGIRFLRAQANASIPAIFSAQVVEHLPYEEFISFLELSCTKLRPGGQLIFETVNPHAIEAFKTFWTDLTHNRPIFPEVAVAWCWLTGFEQAYVFFPTGTGDLEQDRSIRGEYAVIAKTSADPKSA
jgi:2-polyprenyl-3-methyl-5-hydroxy-6-metoxy-1,4-benzoquinol methylase